MYKMHVINPHNLQMIRSLLEHSWVQEEEKRRENFHSACIDTSIMVVLFLFIDFGNVKFFTKTLIIMSISTDIYWPYVCDPLGPYISLVNDSINPITLTDLS